MSQKDQMKFFSGLFGVLVILFFLLFDYQGSTNSLLFSNLESKDQELISHILMENSIPYSKKNNELFVSNDTIYRSRYLLASKGFPKSGNVKLGGKSEIELEKTISNWVSGTAKIRLSKESETNKATIFISTNLKKIEGLLISNIRHLVSSCVPYLSEKNVTIVDSNGVLLSPVSDNTSGEIGKIQYRLKVESDISKKIQNLFESVVGIGNVHVQSAVDIDFSENVETKEIFGKNSEKANQSVRSHQLNETSSVTHGILGDSGTISVAGVSSSIGSVSAPSCTKNETINFEVDRTVTHTKEAIGKVTKLSMAVVLKNRKENGKVKAYTDAEMSTFSNLAKDAIGFSLNRGDTIKIASVDFHEFVSGEKDSNQEDWRDLVKIVLPYAIAIPLLILFATWMKIPKFVEPEKNSTLVVNSNKLAMFQDVQEIDEKFNTDLSDSNIALGGRHSSNSESGSSSSRNSYDEKLQKMKDLAKSDPQAVAAILKSWIQ